MTSRKVSPEMAKWLLFGAIGLLAVAFGLALYSVPSDIPEVPSFPFFSLPFPLLSGLLVVSSILLASGWISHPRGSLRQLLFVSMSLITIGVILRVVSFIAAVPVDLAGGRTVLLEPYAAHTTMVFAIGAFLAIFGMLFWAVDRRERRREGMVAGRAGLTKE